MHIEFYPTKGLTREQIWRRLERAGLLGCDESYFDGWFCDLYTLIDPPGQLFEKLKGYYGDSFDDLVCKRTETFYIGELEHPKMGDTCYYYAGPLQAYPLWGCAEETVWEYIDMQYINHIKKKLGELGWLKEGSAQ